MKDELRALTDAELDQIEQRCRAASKPPWQSFIEGRDIDSASSFIMIGGLGAGREDDMYVSRDTVRVSDADLDFIAHARQDLPRLVAEVRRLRAALLSDE